MKMFSYWKQILLIKHVKASMKALTYSNLFKVSMGRKRNRQMLQPTLKDMQANPRKHFNPFISIILLEKQYFGVPKYFFRLNCTSGVQRVPMCFVQWIQFNEEKQTHNCILVLPLWSNWNSGIPFKSTDWHYLFHLAATFNRPDGHYLTLMN